MLLNTYNSLEKVVGVVSDVNVGVRLQHLDESLELLQLVFHLKLGMNLYHTMLHIHEQ